MERFAAGDVVQVRPTNKEYAGRMGAVIETGTFDCMGGAYKLTGVKVLLSRLAGPVILDPDDLDITQKGTAADE